MSLLILNDDDLIAGDNSDWILEGLDDDTYDLGLLLIKAIRQGWRQTSEMVRLFPDRAEGLSSEHNAAARKIAEELRRLLDLSACFTCGKFFAQPWSGRPFLYCDACWNEMKEEEVRSGTG